MVPDARLATTAIAYLLAAVIVLLVCASRVYLGVHYPSDVLAGAVFGTLIGEAVR